MEASGSVTDALPKRYRIVRELGRGGFAIVYLAEDSELGRLVAIKVLRSELSGSIWRDRFLQEIAIEAKLQHPNILPIFDAGEVEDSLFYTMPFVEGESLADRLKREGELPIEEALRITEEVALALGQAHAHGVVHRDIKPGNILLSNGQAVVADFGIARASAAAGAVPLTKDTATMGTPTGVAIGTPEYMSPEQVAGDGTIDGKSDQYSLACVLFEMLAGDPPFTGRTMQSVINRHISEPPPSLEHRRPKAPEHIVRAVDRALSKVPADRYPTMEAFVRALETPVVPRIKWRGLATVAAAALLVTTGLLVLRPRGQPLDPNRIIVFPIRDAELADGGAGERVATTLGWVLEGTEPLRWVRGRDFMDPLQLRDPTLLTVPQAQRIAHERQAGYFVDGDILRTRDSVTVLLRLFRTGEDAPVRSAGSSGPIGTSEPSLGISAMIDLVFEVVAPGRVVDRAGLSLRNTAAVTNFSLGEEEYRRSHFSDALAHYQDAVRADSMFSLAAIRGAQAANWLERSDVAELLTNAALQHDSLLPQHYADFARGLASYNEGEADSAVAQLRVALSARNGWPEAWMALGEVYYHLLPGEAPLDSLAESAFLVSRQLDSAFSAPLYHLIEIAVRRGRESVADSLAGVFYATQPDSSVRTPIEMMLRCRNGASSVTEWPRLARADFGSVIEAAHTLASGTKSRLCAMRGFRAVTELDAGAFSSPGEEARYKFAAKFALHALLLEEQRYDDVRALYAEDRAGPYILWQDALEYDVFLRDVAERVDSTGNDYSDITSTVLWLLGVWEAEYGSSESARAVAETLRKRSRASGALEDSLFGAIVAAHAALGDGDSVAAEALFRGLRPMNRRPVLAWGVYEALGLERLTLGRLLLARREYREAIDVLSAFDSPQPISYLMYRRQSLELRVEAAEAIGDAPLADRCREVLAALRSRATAG